MALLVITGPTASGKTSRAVGCARSFDGEIISSDSRQVYRGMDIGTGKDLSEYGEVAHHLIDIAPAGARYNLYEYLRDAEKAMRNIESRGRLPIMCGGTGLYIESFLKGLRLPEVPENQELRQSLAGVPLNELAERLGRMKRLHNVTDIDSPQRAIRAIEIETYYAMHPEVAQEARKETATPMDAVIVGVGIDRENRRRRISSRLESRLQEGMIDEVKALLDSGIDPEDLIYYGLEYKYVTLYLIGKLNGEEMKSQLETAIHQFAKRQMTWFRGMERRGFTINWLPWDAGDEEFTECVADLLKQREWL